MKKQIKHPLHGSFKCKLKDSIKRKIKFDLTFKQFVEIKSKTHCYYTGVKLNNINHHPNQLTLDRVDNTKGYTYKNTVVCSYHFNMLKDNLTLEEITLMYNGIKNRKPTSRLAKIFRIIFKL